VARAVGAFDINMSQITPEQKITGYSLIVRPGDPTLTGTPPDASTYSIFGDSSQSGSSSSPTTESSTNIDATNSSSQWLIYAAIIIIVVIAVVITIKTLPKRKSAENMKTKPKATTGASPKTPSKKPQRIVGLQPVLLFKYFLRTLVSL
jgi:hypothetical protein